MAKKYSYAHTSYSHCGLMICSGCSKKITDGDYRYREGKDGYILHHRDCSQDDPQWNVIKKQREDAAKRYADMLREAIAFRDKFQVDDLDELIAVITSQPTNSAAKEKAQ